MTTKGTQEWASSNINIQKGCANGCIYCYACAMALRFERVKSYNDWVNNSTLVSHAINKNYRKRKGRIMFPTSHDIFEENMEECFLVLKKILRAGNEVLITTKPRINVIKYLTSKLDKFKSQILWRFTITSINNELSKKFEPGAPDVTERINSLKFAFHEDWKTSISIEPYLDENPERLIWTLVPFVTDTIWIGIMSGRILNGMTIQDVRVFKRRYKKQKISDLLPSWRYAARNKLRLKDSIRILLGVEK